MMKCGLRLSQQMGLACVCVALLVAGRLEAAAPTAAISASPTSGNAPLGVLFDSTGSSADAVTFLWNFGDGSASTAKTVTHVYTVAGTYNATLTVTNAGGETGLSTIVITVSGTGQGPVTENMNFRLALQSGKFTLKRNAADRDQTTLTFNFNTVDLPSDLRGLSASFSINSLFTVSGVIGSEDGFANGENRKPQFEVRIIQNEQRLEVFIGRAELKTAFAASGAGDITTTGGGASTPVTFTFTIGAQTYTLSENFNYTATLGVSGRGEFNLKKKTGQIRDGFFVVQRGSALENDTRTAHFYEFETLLSRPAQKLIQAPGAGSFRITLNEADTEVILFDRLRSPSGKILFDQQDRALAGTRKLTIDVDGRRLVLRTWDIEANANRGGTGLPLRGQQFTAFNFTIRIEFDQPDGTVFQAVTGTRLTRKSEDDALWQSGRRKSAGL